MALCGPFADSQLNASIMVKAVSLKSAEKQLRRSVMCLANSKRVEGGEKYASRTIVGGKATQSRQLRCFSYPRFPSLWKSVPSLFLSIVI